MRDKYRAWDKKIQYPLKLRPSTIELLHEAKTKTGEPCNKTIENGTIKEAKRILKKC